LALLRNGGSRGHWLEVAFERFSPGARVTLELRGGQRLVREVQAGSSYLSSEDPRLHFGLGRAARVKTLVVRLPGGRTIRRANVATNQVVTIP
jgi:enediyne biosynthesis protein E4